jgi:hypothetical protein
VPQVGAGVPQPPGLGGEPGQSLHHRQGDKLRVAQLQDGARRRPPRRELRFLQQVLGSDVQR